jgi:hypothetical protein
MIGSLLVIFGVLGIAQAIFAKEFLAVDGLGLHEFKKKRKLPTWLGRLVGAIVGLGLIAVGVKMLIGGE